MKVHHKLAVGVFLLMANVSLAGAIVFISQKKEVQAEGASLVAGSSWQMVSCRIATLRGYGDNQPRSMSIGPAEWKVEYKNTYGTVVLMEHLKVTTWENQFRMIDSNRMEDHLSFSTSTNLSQCTTSIPTWWENGDWHYFMKAGEYGVFYRHNRDDEAFMLGSSSPKSWSSTYTYGKTQ